jgi:hypothetical protein
VSETQWNGEPCQARRVTAIVADNGVFPMYWARHLVGTRRKVVEVEYGGETFYLDDEDGSGWNKVTHGGSPHWGHSNLTIEPDSIQPRILGEQKHAAEAERDGAYRERAHLLALLAALHPSVITPAPDVDEDGWQILYLRIGGKQASWHIAPGDAGLFAHVEHVPADDRRAQWDGHTTEQKYAHIGQHAARLYAEARGRAETPADEQYRFATTWPEYHAGRRAALDEPKES